MQNNRTAPEAVNNAPTSTIGDNSPQAHASVQDRAGLYIAIVALIVACLSLGMQLTQSQLIDAKIDAKIAQAKADVQQQASDANAFAKIARADAGVALDKLEDLRTQLAAKGIKVELDGH